MTNRRGIGGFSKGRSGNPGGRPKVLKDIQELSRQFAPLAIATLASIADDPKAPAAARVSAAQALLDRGYGRPAQAVEHTAHLAPGALVFRWLSETDQQPINSKLIEHQSVQGNDALPTNP